MMQRRSRLDAGNRMIGTGCFLEFSISGFPERTGVLSCDFDRRLALGRRFRYHRRRI
jgi:hypothetical protein